MHLNIITPETSWSYGSVTWNPDRTRAYSLRLRLSLRLCHWNIHRCQYWCENYCLFMTLYIDVSFIRWKRHHQHWNYFATAFPGLTQISWSDSVSLTWFDSRCTYFLSNSSHIIWTKFQSGFRDYHICQSVLKTIQKWNRGIFQYSGNSNWFWWGHSIFSKNKAI